VILKNVFAMKKYFLLILISSIVAVSCKKDDLPSDTYTLEEQARDNLYEIMNLNYLWYKLMSVVVKEEYKDPYELMDALRYEPTDRWSFVQDYNEYLSESKGSFVGHGIRIGLDQGNKTRIALIYNKSPMYALGVRRGWIVKKINDTDLAPLFINKDYEAYNALIGPSEAGVTNKFLFEMPNGKDSTITTTKAAFILNTVLVSDTLNLKSGVAGHMVYDQFISPSNQEFETAFAYFKKNNVKTLIIDLRYNGGGDLSVLQNLASYIAGPTRNNKLFLNLVFNDKKSSKNGSYTFKSVPYPLELTRLIVITTRSTASASENLINGLKPYLDVRTIGDYTNGKPVGMQGSAFQSTYMFWPITFSLTNAEDKGEFYEGFTPEKFVADDITHDWNDRRELCLQEAIYYLENGSVSTKGTYDYRPSVHFAEKPVRRNNAYRIEE
jgi:C-terminal processing protease CtpA/Prc